MIVTLLITLSAPFSVSAKESAKVSITTSDVSLQPGDVVTFTVTVSDCDLASSMGIIPTYDEQLFDFVSGEWLLADALLSDFSDGVATIAYPNARSMNGEVLMFTLKVKDNSFLKPTTVTALVSIKHLNETVDCTVSPVSMQNENQSLIVQSQNSSSESNIKFPIIPVLIGVIVCVGIGIIFVLHKKKHRV